MTHAIYNFNAIGRGDISLAKNERTYQPSLVQNSLTAPWHITHSIVMLTLLIQMSMLHRGVLSNLGKDDSPLSR